MSYVSQSIEIKAPAKKCFEIISDYESYPEFIKDTKEIAVCRNGKSVEVTYTLDLIKKITYTLKMHEKPPKKIQWSLVRGDMMRANDGEWILEEIKGKTTATYNIELKLGLFVPSRIEKMLVEKNLPSMLRAFKERIEGS